jgi:hypothetical protein
MVNRVQNAAMSAENGVGVAANVIGDLLAHRLCGSHRMCALPLARSFIISTSTEKTAASRGSPKA